MSDFDVNILQDALTNPNIELSFPLPSDKEISLPLKSNEKVSTSFRLLEHFIHYFTNVRIFEIYKNAEGRFSVYKSSKLFNGVSESFMNDKLERSDKELDKIVYDLIDSELKMNLITARDFSSRLKEVKSFMVNYYKQENLRNLPKFGSHSFIRLCYITVIKTLTKMFPQGVWTSRKQFSSLYKTYLEDPMSIVLLPNHQSHIDYVILHLILIRFQMSLPTVIAGDNLNVAIFGSILKGLGGIFIKRSFNNEAYTERNLANYIEFVLLNKIHFEVFIEGTRSRDGKLLLPKYGILKTLTSIYKKQRDEEKNSHFDFLIQPVSITYERIYEADGYLHELIGEDKKQESFMNIMSNGVSNMFSRGDCDKVKRLSDGFVDNSVRPLNGKIFVTLAENFTFSSHCKTSRVSADHKQDLDIEQNVNLKQLGFRILHSINEIAYIPECAVIGLTLQTFYYYDGRKDFLIKDLLPIMSILMDVIEQEKLNDSSIHLFKTIRSMSEEGKISLIEMQMIKFFRFTRVNTTTKVVRVVNSFELLYYKNLTIHLIIHKCLVSFILLGNHDYSRMKNLFHIFTGILKNEFLFDYDYNTDHQMSTILENYKNRGLISSSYEMTDKHHHKILATIVKPFIESFTICAQSLKGLNSERCTKFSEQQLIEDIASGKQFVTTKSLLKSIQKSNSENFKNDNASYHVETYNKQYLLSFLFYLNNLKIVKIVKNKSRTKAFVMIENSEDLFFICDFMGDIHKKSVDDSSVSYMIDIVDKNPCRNSPLDVKHRINKL